MASLGLSSTTFWYAATVCGYGCGVVLLVQKDVALLHVELGYEILSVGGDVVLAVFGGFLYRFVKHLKGGVDLVGGCELLAHGVDQGRDVSLAVVCQFLCLGTDELGLCEGLFKITQCCLFVTCVECCGSFIVERGCGFHVLSEEGYRGKCCDCQNC